MPIQEWSEGIYVVDPSDGLEFREEISSLDNRLSRTPHHVVVDLHRIEQASSSYLGQLLQLRQRLDEADRQLRLCGISDRLWGVMLVTGLDKIFTFTEDLPSALASLQLAEES